MMWPFKWKLPACTYTWCYLFFKRSENEIWTFGWTLPLAKVWQWKGLVDRFLLLVLFLFLGQIKREEWETVADPYFQIRGEGRSSRPWDKGYCTVPQMISNRKWSRDRKWSPKWTANDPRPQVIPKVDRKWSRKKNRNGLDSSLRIIV